MIEAFQLQVDMIARKVWIEFRGTIVPKKQVNQCTDQWVLGQLSTKLGQGFVYA